MSTPAKSPSRDTPRSIPPSEHVRRLVEANRVDEARSYVSERRARGEAALESWERLLEPPRAAPEPGSRPTDVTADHAWLRANRDAFLGYWVALRGGTLLDSDVALRPMVDRLRTQGQLEGTLVVRVD
ncbi:MAG: hypothetical protein U0441_19040 [Polyangiaceae bacterium]